MYCVQEMVIRALKQTNSRSVEAAIEYISKMSYQDPVREQMVAAAARPVNAGMKAPGRCLSSGTKPLLYPGLFTETWLPLFQDLGLGYTICLWRYNQLSMREQDSVEQLWFGGRECVSNENVVQGTGLLSFIFQ